MAGILVGNSSSNEAVGELGFKGERGYSAYEIAVQHGYIGTEDEWLASKNEKWQDEGGVEVKFFKGDTEDIEDRAIIHGQLLYNTDSGETFLDYETNRINTGSGNVVSISDTEPTNEATKLWINPDEQLNNIGTEIESGSNANGNYIKFADGTLICSAVLGPITTPSMGGTTSQITLPYNFVDGNYITNTEIVDGQGYWGAIQVSTGSKTANGFTLAVWNSGSGSNTNQYFNYIAIGRWK